MDHNVLVNMALSGIIAFLFWKIKQFEGKDYVTRADLEKSEFRIEVKIDELVREVTAAVILLTRLEERMKKQ
jgi:hypothetical protein